MYRYMTTAPVDSTLASWFTQALAQGLLPAEPFELAPAQLVAEPQTLYAWLAGVIARADAGATAREAERAIRNLFHLCGGWEKILPQP